MAMMTQVSGQQLNDLLSKLGVPSDFAQTQSRFLATSSVAVLTQLQLGYVGATDVGQGAHAFQQVLNEKDRRLPPFGWNRPPSQMFAIMDALCGAGYAGGQVGIGADHEVPVERFFNRRRRLNGMLERLLTTNLPACAAFESAMGGKVVGFGQGTGRILIERYKADSASLSVHQGGLNAPSSQTAIPANTALGIFAQMEQAILDQAGMITFMQNQNAGGNGAASGGNPFPGMVLAGLGAISGSDGIGMAGGALGGVGVGSWNPLVMPGRINNTNPLYERAHQNQVSSVLADPSLTVEDKVTLMLMVIMSKMDDDIQRQGEYINSMQQQQADRSGSDTNFGSPLGKISAASGGMAGPGVGQAFSSSAPFGSSIGATFQGGPLGGAMATNQGSPSVDVESMKLKRMIDKRTQMFDILRSIIDKYNEAAKNIIQSIGR